jgi:hypothetical protein
LQLQIFGLPRNPEWLVGRPIVLITVAGPRRTHTGFSFMPSQAPEMSEQDNGTIAMAAIWSVRNLDPLDGGLFLRRLPRC